MELHLELSSNYPTKIASGSFIETRMPVWAHHPQPQSMRRVIRYYSQASEIELATCIFSIRISTCLLVIFFFFYIFPDTASSEQIVKCAPAGQRDSRIGCWSNWANTPV